MVAEVLSVEVALLAAEAVVLAVVLVAAASQAVVQEAIGNGSLNQIDLVCFSSSNFNWSNSFFKIITSFFKDSISLSIKSI